MHGLRKNAELKGSLSVEAALVCPFLCLAVFAVILFTLHLYEETVLFSETAVQELRQKSCNAEMLRTLRMVCKWIK